MPTSTRSLRRLRSQLKLLLKLEIPIALSARASRI